MSDVRIGPDIRAWLMIGGELAAEEQVIEVFIGDEGRASDRAVSLTAWRAEKGEWRPLVRAYEVDLTLDPEVVL